MGYVKLTWLWEAVCLVKKSLTINTLNIVVNKELKYDNKIIKPIQTED